MAYCRGSSSVFDEWAELSGNPGLAWNSLLEDFRETSDYGIEAYADYEQFVNTTVYGDGPLQVSRNGGLTGFDIPFADALKSTFDIEDIDMTDGSGIGLDRGIASINAGERTRSYARVTFGTLIENRPNVQMIHSAEVSNIGFSGQTAVNVTYLDILKNKTSTIKAKEIIVSSGAINTPKLLMLSGVGPKDQLSKLDIPVIADIPDVGSNLFDHVFSIVQLEVTPEVKTFWQLFVNVTAKALAEEQYAANRSGPLGWNNGYTHAAFRLPDSVWDGISGTHYTDSPADRPHVLMEYTGVGFLPGNVSSITAWVSLVQPEASGHVALNSSDFRDDPLIFTNYYGSEADKAAMIYGYKKLRDEVLGTDAVKSLTVRELYPGTNVTSDEDIWAAIQKQSYSFRHPVGTVAIGKALDSNWRIKGLQGIRVVDSSTFPTPPSCHPQADVYALAHRAAKDIRKADSRPSARVRIP